MVANIINKSDQSVTSDKNILCVSEMKLLDNKKETHICIGNLYTFAILQIISFMPGKITRISLIQPQKFPFFYGYVIAAIGTMGILASLPGQTVGVSTFTDPVKDAMGLNRDQISFAYMLGTFLSSLFLGLAGKWFDKFGARRVAVCATLGLTFSLVLCSRADIINNALKGLLGAESFLLPLSVMVVLFFMLRFSGQGVLTLASRNMIMKWFDNLRGRVNAFSSVVISLGFSASPVWINALINKYGWQNSWLIMALGILLFSGVVFIFFRDNPEEFNLLPDGISPQKQKENIPSVTRRQFTLAEARKTRAFWAYSFTIAFYGFFVTGMTFHVISIFAKAGYTAEKAVGIFIPISIISVAVSLLSNFLSDWIKLKTLLFMMIGSCVLASLGIVFLSNEGGVYLLIAGTGAMAGLYFVLSAVAWPRFYGRKHLGAISGKTMSMIVMASAGGPILFSLSNTFVSTYAGVGVLSLGFLVFLTIISVKAHNPQ